MGTRTPFWPGMFRYCLAVWLPLAAFGLQWLLSAAMRQYIWFFFFPAVFFSSWIGGMPDSDVLPHPVEPARCVAIDLALVDREVTEEDDQAFARINDTKLTPEQVERIVNPPRTYPRQEYVLAVHWHPEHVPMSWPRGNRS